jgi:polyketide synthase 13
MGVPQHRIAIETHAMENWLRHYVAQCVHVDASHIDVQADFVDLGLSSRDVVAMTAELETLTGQLIDPAVVFDFPTIHRLAQQLASHRT